MIPLASLTIFGIALGDIAFMFILVMAVIVLILYVAKKFTTTTNSQEAQRNAKNTKQYARDAVDNYVAVIGKRLDAKHSKIEDASAQLRLNRDAATAILDEEK